MSAPCITHSPWQRAVKYSDEDMEILMTLAFAYALSGRPDFSDRAATRTAINNIGCWKSTGNRLAMEHALSNLALTSTYSQVQLDEMLANMKAVTSADERKALRYKVLRDILGGIVQNATAYS